MKISNKIYKSYNKSTGSTYKYLCYAPFNTLRFNEDGKVTACCLNTDDVLGNLFEDSISDIINGKVRKNFQKQVKKCRLPEGCSFCINDLKNSNFNDIATKWYPPVKKKGNLPIVLEFKTSLKCNLKCIMCSNSYRVESDKKQELFQYDQTFRQEIKKLIPDLHYTTFNGGEPLVIDLYYDIWEDIIELNPKCLITIHTSLCVMPERFKNIFKRGNIKIVVSIDSLIPEVYEKIRVNAKFSKVMDNFNFIIQNSNSEIGLNLCPMNNNWKEIPDFIKFCNEKKATFNFSVVYFPFTHSLFNTDNDTFLSRLEWLENEYKKLPNGLNNPKFEAFILRLKDFQSKVLNNQDYLYSKQEFLNYISRIDPNNIDIKNRINEISDNIKEGNFLNLFKVFGENHTNRTSAIIMEMNEHDLIANLNSLNIKNKDL